MEEVRVNDDQLRMLGELQNVRNYRSGDKLIYKWIKDGRITVTQFTTLCNYNRDLDKQK